MREGKCISVNNFSAQEHASSKNRHILNFRVMAVHEKKAMNMLVEKNIYLSWDFEPFWKLKVLGRVLI